MQVPDQGTTLELQHFSSYELFLESFKKKAKISLLGEQLIVYWVKVERCLKQGLQTAARHSRWVQLALQRTHCRTELSLTPMQVVHL